MRDLQSARGNLYRIAAHAKRPALKRNVVADILKLDKLRDNRITFYRLPLAHRESHRHVIFFRTNTIDARDRGHDDAIFTLEQGAGSSVAHAVDLLVNAAVFFDEGIGARDIGFGLVIIVIGHEIFHRVIGEEGFELTIKLRRQSFIRRKDQRRTLQFLNGLGNGEGLARPRRA